MRLMSNRPVPPPATPAELAGFPLFQSMSEADLQAVARVLQVREYEPAEIVFERGDRGDAMFLIRRGQVRIFMTDADGNDVTFRTYGPQQIIGEFSLIDGQPRSASADAYDLAQLLILERGDFTALLRDHPLIGIEMMRALAERLRYGTRALEKAASAVEMLKRDDFERALQEMTLDGHDEQLHAMISSFVEMIASMQKRKLQDGAWGRAAESDNQRT